MAPRSQLTETPNVSPHLASSGCTNAHKYAQNRCIKGPEYESTAFQSRRASLSHALLRGWRRPRESFSSSSCYASPGTSREGREKNTQAATFLSPKALKGKSTFYCLSPLTYYHFSPLISGRRRPMAVLSWPLTSAARSSRLPRPAFAGTLRHAPASGSGKRSSPRTGRMSARVSPPGKESHPATLVTEEAVR